MNSQIDMLDMLDEKPKVLNLRSAVEEDEITKEISNVFDYKFDGGGDRRD